MLYGWSSWEWGFLMEGAAALLSLVVLGSRTETPELPSPGPRYSLVFLPFLVLGSAALLYCLHWGQLHGWLESPDIVIRGRFRPRSSWCLSLLLVYPQLDFLALSERAGFACFCSSSAVWFNFSTARP